MCDRRDVYEYPISLQRFRMARMIFLCAATILWIVCGVTSAYENVALQGRATQSSINRNVNEGFLTNAINAIDGNQDSSFFHGSCSCTHYTDLSPWWRVDLLRPYKIAYIIITSMAECCGERLDGAEILVGDSLTNNGNDNPRCAVVASIPTGGTQTFKCEGVVGRYVNIILRGKYTYLVLCEVQVFGDYVYKSGERDENVALRGRATQSSIYRDLAEGYLGNAINAIDGNLDSTLSHGSCSHTHSDLSPWWRVDLLRPYKIAYINITNRGDCCGWRLDGAEILVGDSLANNGNDNPRCATVTSIPTGGTQSFRGDGIVGRYVNIILRGKIGFLQLCEVQVFGEDAYNCIK